MSPNELKNLIQVWIRNSYLNELSFDVTDEILNHAIISFKEDYLRWHPSDEHILQKRVERNPQLIAILLYRISHIMYVSRDNLEDRYRNEDAYSLLSRHIGQMELFYSAEIGNGLKINHGIGLIIGARCKVGNNCLIHQGCTIGDRNGGRPVIGNNVTLYAGSMVLGDIQIGDNCIIGANSIVTRSFPENCVLVGSPAKCVKYVKDS